MGALYALAGAAAGFAVFLIFYLLGGMGGGDVKLMAGFGALLGAGGCSKPRCGRRVSAESWRWRARGGRRDAPDGVRSAARAGAERVDSLCAGDRAGRVVVAGPKGRRRERSSGLAVGLSAEGRRRAEYGSQVFYGIGRQPGVRAGGVERVLSDDGALEHGQEGGADRSEGRGGGHASAGRGRDGQAGRRQDRQDRRRRRFPRAPSRRWKTCSTVR